MEGINERLALLREAMGKTKTDFARFTGIEQSRYSNFESGKNKPAQDALALLAERIPNLNFHWLLTGKGQMFTDLKPDVVKQPVMSPLQESQELKEMRRERDLWREMALTLAKSPSAGLAATGTDALNFEMSNRLSAELTEATPLKMVS
ncbi:helix-turn-helix transcriptional regulator [Hymenobacter sp.]|jgi:transcriptional regulator with XRE-family HTH domain|uniref:helix-turn-helix domain-containing protein n=1 Tax=Hymenobacter sp. TaxID=1898978 RepID=UPI002ED8F6F0